MDSVEALVAHIQGLSGSPAEISHLHSILKQSEETLRVHASNLAPYIEQLEPSSHSLGYLYLLEAYSSGSVSRENVSSFHACVVGFINSCSAEQIRIVPEKFISLCKRFKDQVIQHQLPIQAVAPFLTAVRKLQSSHEQLTTLHSDYLLLCLLSKCYKAGTSILNDEILEIDQPRDFFLYCYYGGMINIGLKRFRKALECFHNVVTAPMTTINAIAIEAYKKYILVSLIHQGQIPTFPKYTASSAQRSLKSYAQVHNGEVVFSTVHSDDEAYKMYSEYARINGFSVRKQHIFYWTHTRIIKGREFSCSKAGFKLENSSIMPKKFHHRDTRTGCLACLHFRADQDGKNWKIIKFIEEHNHPLTLPKDAHLLRSHRHVSEAQAGFIKHMTGVGIRTVDTFNLMAEEVGGAHNVGFTKSDAYNLIHREKRAIIESGDATRLIEIFKERQLLDNMFSYDIQVDEMSRLQNFFWIDGPAKLDYECFGDVIIFDTTYRLNRYNLACAPFIAVNHHWQNVFVGCAFVAQETIASFCWVFETFLKFVGGKQPTTIFIDQDQAMAVAIERVFTTTRHRLCQWHISKKAPSKVPTFNQDKQIRFLFYTCMSKCENEIEFEIFWKDMITKGNLQENRWLNDLYNIRRKWSTAFNKGILDLGILSTQRSESANNCLHGCSKPTSSLVECFLGLEKLVHGWRRSEHEEDFKCKEGLLTLKFKSYPILKQMSKIYTRKIYSIFEQAYMEGAVGLIVTEEIRNDINTVVYHIRSCDEGGSDKQWVVTIHTQSNAINCSCMGFETKGMLCLHALRVYNNHNVRLVDSNYILKRLTMQAKKLMNVMTPITSNHYESNSIFRNQMMRYTYDLCQKTANCQIGKDYLVNVMNDVGLVLEGMVENDEKKKKGVVEYAQFGEGVLKDPKSMRPKGAPNARMKNYWESKSKKPRKSRLMKMNGRNTIDVDGRPQELNVMEIAGETTTIPTQHSADLNNEFSVNDISINVPVQYSCLQDVFKG